MFDIVFLSFILKFSRNYEFFILNKIYFQSGFSHFNYLNYTYITNKTAEIGQPRKNFNDPANENLRIIIITSYLKLLNCDPEIKIYI